MKYNNKIMMMNSSRKYKPMQMNRYNTIRNRLTAYKVQNEAVPLIEFIGNGLDAGATKIDIKFIKESTLNNRNNNTTIWYVYNRDLEWNENN